MNYYLGIDSGGTFIKAALYDEDGRMKAAASMPTPAEYPDARRVECDMEELWRRACGAVRKAVEESGVPKEQIAGVGICGHGKGVYLTDGEGNPVRRGILSADQRAVSYAEDWNKRLPELHEILWQPFLGCQQACLLAWLRDHEPETLAKTKWVFSCKDYIRFRLTGEPANELTDLSGNGFFDQEKAAVSGQVLEKLGISCWQDRLPPLCGPLDPVGEVCKKAAGEIGLREGTPVIGGFFDVDACAVTANASDLQCLLVIAGTWSINAYLSPVPVRKVRSTLNTVSYLPGYYLVEESSPSSASNLEWFAGTLCPELKGRYGLMDRMAEAAEITAGGPLFLPYIYGSALHPGASACLAGVRSGHGTPEILRSVYEGIVFSHRMHIENLRNGNRGLPRVIRLVGGVARSEVWTQMFADICGMPVERVAAEEAGTLGCAIAACCSTRRQGEPLSRVAAQMSELCEPVYPREQAAKIYREKFERIRSLTRAMADFWEGEK